ncbi:MAG: hypothetical protein HOW73_46130 [Polyangiaceae bacterium]|nr:hypothetical protein [Polyangiaceae bacterium]
MPSSTPPVTVTSVILTFRWNSSGHAPGAAQRGEELAREAEANGATLCAFGPFEMSFAFGEGDVLEAAQLAARVVQTGGELSRAGMAFGEIMSFLEGEGFVRLAVGAPIVIATALARFAQPGEVVVDAPLAKEALRFTGPARSITLGNKARATFLLDVAAPVGTPPEEIDQRLTPVDEPDRAPSIEVRDSDAPPGGRELLELAREALTKGGDRIGIGQAVAELNLTEDHADVVERLAGVLAMTRGAKEEGLRVLRRAAETEQREDKRGRAVLAYAIGVAAAGRYDDALLEALSALAIARARGDRSGEKACARFLAQLSFSTGQPEAASAWEHVAQAVEAVG